MTTTMSALLVAVPLAVSVGVGAELRRPLGITVVGGLLLSQVLTLYIRPVDYLYLDRLSHLMRAMPCGILMTPPLANAVYAVATSIGVSSKTPSAIEG